MAYPITKRQGWNGDDEDDGNDGGYNYSNVSLHGCTVHSPLNQGADPRPDRHSHQMGFYRLDNGPVPSMVHWRLPSRSAKNKERLATYDIP